MSNETDDTPEEEEENKENEEKPQKQRPKKPKGLLNGEAMLDPLQKLAQDKAMFEAQQKRVHFLKVK